MAVQPNAQQILKQFNPANKSAHIKQAVDMLTQLKKSTGNPKAINAVGPQHLLGMLQGFFDKFRKNKKPKNAAEAAELLLQQQLLEQQIKAIQQQIIVNQRNGIS